MAGDFDELVKQLLQDVAFAGSQGLGVGKLSKSVQEFVRTRDALTSTTIQAGGPSSVDAIPPAHIPALESALIDKAWEALSKQPDIHIEEDELTVEDAQENEEGSDSHSPAIATRLKHAGKRLVTTQKKIWRAVAGHAVDRERIPSREFELLLAIASHGPAGILQPSLVKLTGQDKRSVPKRTDALANKGYIIKDAVSLKRVQTSLLRLKRFAVDGLPLSGELLHYDALFEDVMRLLTSQPEHRMALTDLHISLGIRHKKSETRHLQGCLKRIVRSGLLRQITVDSQPNSETTLTIGTVIWTPVKCVELLREPTDVDKLVWGKIRVGPAKLARAAGDGEDPSETADDDTSELSQDDDSQGDSNESAAQRLSGGAEVPRSNPHFDPGDNIEPQRILSPPINNATNSPRRSPASRDTDTSCRPSRGSQDGVNGRGRLMQNQEAVENSRDPCDRQSRSHEETKAAEQDDEDFVQFAQSTARRLAQAAINKTHRFEDFDGVNSPVSPSVKRIAHYTADILSRSRSGIYMNPPGSRQSKDWTLDMVAVIKSDRIKTIPWLQETDSNTTAPMDRDYEPDNVPIGERAGVQDKDEQKGHRDKLPPRTKSNSANTKSSAKPGREAKSSMLGQPIVVDGDESRGAVSTPAITAVHTSSPGTLPDMPGKKKRGRPTKAMVAERKRAELGEKKRGRPTKAMVAERERAELEKAEKEGERRLSEADLDTRKATQPETMSPSCNSPTHLARTEQDCSSLPVQSQIDGKALATANTADLFRTATPPLRSERSLAADEASLAPISDGTSERLSSVELNGVDVTAAKVVPLAMLSSNLTTHRSVTLSDEKDKLSKSEGFNKAYVKLHPDEVFHHRGGGRWERGEAPSGFRKWKKNQPVESESPVQKSRLCDTTQVNADLEETSHRNNQERDYQESTGKSEVVRHLLARNHSEAVVVKSSLSSNKQSDILDRGTASASLQTVTTAPAADLAEREHIRQEHRSSPSVPQTASPVVKLSIQESRLEDNAAGGSKRKQADRSKDLTDPRPTKLAKFLDAVSGTVSMPTDVQFTPAMDNYRPYTPLATLTAAKFESVAQSSVVSAPTPLPLVIHKPYLETFEPQSRTIPDPWMHDSLRNITLPQQQGSVGTSSSQPITEIAIDEVKKIFDNRQDRFDVAQLNSNANDVLVPGLATPSSTSDFVPERSNPPGSAGTSLKEPVAKRRKALVMSIIERAGGVFPGKQEMWYPFVTQWEKSNPTTKKPERTTVENLLKTLEKNGDLRSETFAFQSDGKSVIGKVVYSPQATPASVEEMKRHVRDCYPAEYLPEAVEVLPELRTQVARRSAMSDHSRKSDPAIRKINSGNAGPRNVASLDFPLVQGLSVQRTAQGLQELEVERLKQLTSRKQISAQQKQKSAAPKRPTGRLGRLLDPNFGTRTGSRALGQGSKHPYLPSQVAHSILLPEYHVSTGKLGRFLCRDFGAKTVRQALGQGSQYSYLPSQVAHSTLLPEYYAILAPPSRSSFSTLRPYVAPRLFLQPSNESGVGGFAMDANAPHDSVDKPPRKKYKSRKRKHDGDAQDEVAVPAVSAEPDQKKKKWSGPFQDVDGLITAVALIRTLCSGYTQKWTRWPLVAHAMSFRHSTQKLQQTWNFQKLTRMGDLLQLEAAMREPLLKAYEDGELPKIDYQDVEHTDWPALLEWAELNVAVPLQARKSAMKVAKEAVPDLAATMEQMQARFTIQDPMQVYEPERNSFYVHPSSAGRSALVRSYVYSDALPLEGKPGPPDDLMLLKSWCRAVIATKDWKYDAAAAASKVGIFPASMLKRANSELVKAHILSPLKKFRMMPGRNFYLNDVVWKTLKRWSTEDYTHLRDVARSFSRIVAEINETGRHQLSLNASNADMVVLGNLVASRRLKITTILPARNDSFEAPYPNLSAFGYLGYTYDTKSMDRTRLRFPIIYEPSDQWTSTHGLKPAPLPVSPAPFPDEQGRQRIPFWIDIHENLVDDIWDMTVRSILHVVVFRPGSTSIMMEKAHQGKLWAWEIDLVLRWMEQVGLAIRWGTGEEIEGVWKGGWRATDWWYCAFAPDIATWKAPRAPKPAAQKVAEMHDGEAMGTVDGQHG